MKFQFDESKSAANWEKHGIDFDEAQALWDDLICTAIQRFKGLPDVGDSFESRTVG